MGISVFPVPSAASKTMFRTTLTSGTSYTVPAGVTYLNVTLCGGGGGGDSGNAWFGRGGQVVTSTLSVTAGASIAYAIGAGATTQNATGGSTTFTGAATASGGTGNQQTAVTIRNYSSNGGIGNYTSALVGGGSGQIDIEYWA